MPKPRPPKRRPLANEPASRIEPSRLEQGDLLDRLGFRWSATAAVLLLALFFWMWLFIDGAAIRGHVMALVVSPDIWIAEWFGGHGRGSVPSGLFDRLPIVYTVLLILVGCVGPGSLLVGLLTKPGSLDKLEHVILSIGVGLNIASTFVLAGGLIPGSLHQPWWIWLGLLIGLLTSPSLLLRLWRSPAGQTEPTKTTERASDAESPANPAPTKPAPTRSAPASFTERHGGWLIALLSLGYLLGGMLPPWDFDVREYHLQAPKEWMQRGQIDFMPHNVYANMPLGAELHAITATTLLGGDDAWWLGGLTAKTLMSLFAPLTALLLWAICRRSQLPSVGLAAALIYLSLPWVAHVSLNGLNDAVLGFYLLSAWWVWSKSENGDLRALILAGYLAGAATAVKYPAAVFVVVPLFLETLLRILGLRGKQHPLPSFRARLVHVAFAWLLISAGLLGGGSLWYAKNQALTGNPVYPLLVSRLGGETRAPEKDARWTRVHAVPQDARGRRITLTQLYGGLRGFTFSGELASPLLLPLLLCGCWGVVALWREHLARRPQPSASSQAPNPAPPSPALRFALHCFGLLGFSLAAWFLVTHRIERFLVPALPLAALLAGFGYALVKDRAGTTPARVFLGVGLVYSWIFVSATGVAADSRWFVALDYLRVDPAPEPLRDQPPPPLRTSPAERWLSEHLGRDNGVLLVGGARVWDLPGRSQKPNVFYNTCFDDCLLVDWTLNKTPAEQRAAFEERGVKYVVVDWSELRRYLSKGNYGFDSRFSGRQLDQLVRDRVLVEETRLGADAPWQDNKRPRPPQQVYRVLTAGEASAAAAAARAGQKAATKSENPTPNAAPPTSASQSKKSG